MTFHEKFAGAESVYAFLGGFPQIRTSADFAAGFREQAEHEIERLIELLDAVDGDTDLEPDDELEPSLGEPEWTGDRTRHSDNILFYDSRGSFDPDREHDAGDMREDDLDLTEGDDEPDKEPTMGWTLEGENGNQASIQYGEDEPSLGWTGSGVFDVLNPRATDDREDDGADDAEQDAGDCGEIEYAEPDLGWTAQASLSQMNLSGGEVGSFCVDGEQDCGENGEAMDYDEAVTFHLSETERAPVDALRAKLRTLRRRRYEPDTCTILRPGVARMGVWN